MHLKRQLASTKLPIPRKGTKFVVRALSDIENSVPVLIAIRDMLKLARTTKEVKKMLNDNLIKLNGRVVKNYREGIRLFNIFEAGKSYVLTLLPTGRFFLEESKDKKRLCKVINKIVLKNGRIQLNLHDGSNIITNDKISVGDSVYLDFEGKLLKYLTMEKGKDIFVFSGKYIGLKGKIESMEKNKLEINLENEKKTVLSKQQVAVI